MGFERVVESLTGPYASGTERLSTNREDASSQVIRDRQQALTAKRRGRSRASSAPMVDFRKLGTPCPE